MFDGLMIGRRPNPKRADVIDGYAHVDRDPKATHAGVDR
jgi:hypothetical protein